MQSILAISNTSKDNEDGIYTFFIKACNFTYVLAASIEHFKRKRRIDMEVLVELAEKLIWIKDKYGNISYSLTANQVQKERLSIRLAIQRSYCICWL